MNTSLYLLRAKQAGLTLSELDELEEGDVYGIFIESANDSEADSYAELATQADFDAW